MSMFHHPLIRPEKSQIEEGQTDSIWQMLLRQLQSTLLLFSNFWFLPLFQYFIFDF